MKMENEAPMVFVVDDDGSVRKSLERLIRSEGLLVRSFSSGQEFLDEPEYDGNACLIADVRMPGISGLDLQQKLNETGKKLPLIFITGHGDIPMSVRAMKKGAVDFLPKPFEDQALLDAIQNALKKCAEEKVEAEKRNLIQGRYELLTNREKEVFSFVLQGLLNKQIAYEMGISEKTVKVHRARVMVKMKADSLVALARMADRL